ncbi:MAG: hypothetical protein V3575_02010 [Candidatus Absconditabacteria bacterium]
MIPIPAPKLLNIGALLGVEKINPRLNPIATHNIRPKPTYLA